MSLPLLPEKDRVLHHRPPGSEQDHPAQVHTAHTYTRPPGTALLSAHQPQARAPQYSPPAPQPHSTRNAPPIFPNSHSSSYTHPAASLTYHSPHHHTPHPCIQTPLQYPPHAHEKPTDDTRYTTPSYGQQTPSSRHSYVVPMSLSRLPHLLPQLPAWPMHVIMILISFFRNPEISSRHCPA